MKPAAASNAPALVGFIRRVTILALHTTFQARASFRCPIRYRGLTRVAVLCYGSRLRSKPRSSSPIVLMALYVSTTLASFCHALFRRLASLFALATINLAGQTFQPTLPSPPQAIELPANPNARPTRPNAPGPHEVRVRSVTQQEVVGHDYHLRGMVIIETTEMRLEADEVDYNDQTGDAEARGHVVFEHFVRGEKLRCDKADYNVNEETG